MCASIYCITQVKRISPNDPDATKKLKECEKAVQKLRFEEAIAVHESEKRSIADAIDFRSIGIAVFCFHIIFIYLFEIICFFGCILLIHINN